MTNFYLGDSLQKNVWNFNLLFAQALFLRTETSEIVGDLAESLEIASPELVRIKVKAGSTFHDGRAVTCDDVVWSFDDANRAESPYRSTFAAIEKWTCRDGVFEIHLKRPIYALVERLVSGIRIYPKGAYPAQSQHPIGSGPYRFVSTNAQKSVWQKHPGYKGPLKVQSDTIEIYYVPDARARYEWLKSGKLDLLLEWPSDMDPILERDAQNLQVLEYPNANVTVIGFNTRSGCFAKLATRRAFAALLEKNPAWRAPFGPTAPYLLKASASTEVPADRECQRGTLAYPAQSNFAFLGVPLTRAIAKPFKLSVVPQESSVFYSKLAAGAYDAFVMTLPSEEDAVALYEFLHSSQLPPQKNRFYLKDPAVDVLLSDLQVSRNAEERRRILHDLTLRLTDSVPFVPLGRAPGKLVSTKAVQFGKSLIQHPWLMMAEAVKKSDEH